MLCACIPIAGLLIGFSKIFDKGEEFEIYKNQIVITDSQIAFGELKSGQTVEVIGAIKNMSPISWKEIQFHVDFLDATGKRVDVGHKEQYSFYLPAMGTSSFKVSFPRAFPEVNYVKPVIGVSTAKDARARW